MSKQGIRGFASGMVFTLIVLIGTHYFAAPYEPTKTPQTATPIKKEATQKDLEKFAEENGIILVTEDDYIELIEEQNKTLKKAVSNMNEDTSTTSFTLEVQKGMISSQVANMLEDAGIVDSGHQFNLFLYKNGYSHRIQVGEHKVSSDMEYAQIAETITEVKMQ